MYHIFTYLYFVPEFSHIYAQSNKKQHKLLLKTRIQHPCAYTCKLISIHACAFLFSGPDDPYTCVCDFFHGNVNYTPSPINRSEVKAHRMGWVWKRGRQRREAGHVPTGLAHCTGCTTKTSALGHGTPSSGSDTCTITHEYKHIQQM